MFQDNKTTNWTYDLLMLRSCFQKFHNAMHWSIYLFFSFFLHYKTFDWALPDMRLVELHLSYNIYQKMVMQRKTSSLISFWSISSDICQEQKVRSYKHAVLFHQVAGFLCKKVAYFRHFLKLHITVTWMCQKREDAKSSFKYTICLVQFVLLVLPAIPSLSV